MNDSNPPKSQITRFNALDRLKQSLVTEDLVTKEQLCVAELAARRDQKSLHKTLVESGQVSEEQLSAFVGKMLQIPLVDITKYSIDRKVLDR